MRRRTKFAWTCFGANTLAMFTIIGAGQLTGLDELNRAAQGLAWSELGLFAVGAGVWVYESCCPKHRSTTQTVSVSDDLELDSQETIGDPEKTPSPLAEQEFAPLPSSKVTHPHPIPSPSPATYTPVRKISV